MPDLPVNPLADIIAQAARLPARTGATEQHRQRQQHATGGTVILADVSGSMAGSAGARTKYALLQEALDHVLPGLPGASLIAFASTATPIAPGAPLPSPAGGTALHLAIEAAAPARPSKTLVISDGLPDSEDAALRAAQLLTGVIDVIYCGSDDDHAAIAFMQRLARAGGGTLLMRNLSREPLLPAVRQLLALPAHGGHR